MSNTYSLFQRFAPAMHMLPYGPLDREHLLTSRFLLEQDGPLAMYYAPFDFINVAARVMLVGITPGFTQMAEGYEVARDRLWTESDPSRVCAEAKASARFKGMRHNIVSMLDEIGLHTHLGLRTCAELFESRSDLLHSTSAIRYPVFVAGENYRGNRPSITLSNILMRYVDGILVDELHAVPGALIIPLGKAVTEVIQCLALQGKVDLSRCLIGFPHPSGGNGHRKLQFEEHREALRATVDRWFAASKR